MKDILLTLFYLFLFNVIVFRCKKIQLHGFRAVVNCIIFNLKFVAGIGVWLVYSFYYKDLQHNDAHKFYNDASVVYETAKTEPRIFFKLIAGFQDETTTATEQQLRHWQRNFDEAPFNENRTIIRLNAVLMLFSFRTYAVHILMMCFISFIGLVLLVNAVILYCGEISKPLILLVFVLPSVLFWNSGVTKEPVLVFSLGLLISGLIFLKERKGLLPAISMVIGALLVLMIKFYVLVCITPAALAFLVCKKSDPFKTAFLKYLSVNFFVLVAAFNLYHFFPKFDVQQKLLNKQTNSIKDGLYKGAGSQIEIPQLTSQAVSTLKAAPVAVWNTIMRPYVFEVSSPVMLLSAVENVFVAALILFCLAFSDFGKIPRPDCLLFLIVFSISYFVLIGICTPVLGNLVRYKTPLLPCFLLALVLLTGKEKLSAQIPLFNSINKFL